MAWRWITQDNALVIHNRVLKDHGGITGIRDKKLIESALARPKQIAAYDSAATVFTLAAALCNGIIRNHPFIDGNKRTGFLGAYVFLGRNRWDLIANEAEAAAIVLDPAAGTVSEEDFARWLSARSEAIS